MNNRNQIIRPYSDLKIPHAIEEDSEGERVYDMHSRLLKDRKIFLTGKIDENSANSVVSQLLFLESQAETADMKALIKKILIKCEESDWARDDIIRGEEKESRDAKNKSKGDFLLTLLVIASCDISN